MQQSGNQEPIDQDGACFAGIDWGNSHHQLCVVDANGGVLDQVKVTHDIAGIEKLLPRLGRHGKPAGDRDQAV